MNKNKIIVFCGVIFFGVKTIILGFDYGNKPLSMGSAYTAQTGDFYSLYSNPAGLYGGENFDFKLDLLLGANFTGNILYNANQIIESAEKYERIREAQQQNGSIDVVQIAALFNGIKNLVDINKPGKGMIANINGGLGFKIKNFAFSVKNVTNIGLKPFVDTGFSLSTNITSSSAPNLKFASSVYRGITITTSTPPSDSLIDERNELKDIIGNWLIDTLEDLGVDIPSDIKNNPEGIANALINLALENGFTEEDIKNAISQLQDKDLQSLIKDFINNMLNQNSSFTNNNSGLVLKGINYTEFALGYSHNVWNNLLVGGSLKYIIGKTIYYNFKVFQEQDQINFDDLKDIENKLTKNVQSIGLDLGVIYKLPTPLVETNVGLVIKNILEPQFELAGTNEKLKLPRQVKLGVSGKLYKILTLDIDYDLNEVETIVEGYKIKNLALGLELNPPIFPSLRLGYMKNLAYEDDQLYTIGLGIKILVINLDIVGAVNPKETKISKDTTLFANNLSLGLTLGFKF